MCRMPSACSNWLARGGSVMQNAVRWLGGEPGRQGVEALVQVCEQIAGRVDVDATGEQGVQESFTVESLEQQIRAAGTVTVRRFDGVAGGRGAGREHAPEVLVRRRPTRLSVARDVGVEMDQSGIRPPARSAAAAINPPA